MNEIDPLRAFGLLADADLGGAASKELGHDQALVQGPPRLGELLEGRFRLLRPLGQGGMGTVFLGRDEELEREVAIKILSKGGEAARQRFAREAEVTASLSHPHVIRIHGSGQVRGHPYLVYELIPGGVTLGAAFEREPLETRLDLLEQVAAGLAVAHEAGVVHRDLKPENILIRPDGTAVVVDFGLAGLGESSLTRTGQTLGTPAYMAPEQVRGEPATSACDVWALGLLLYEALFQDHAFLDEGSGIEVLLARIYEARLDLPPGGAPALRRLIEATLVSDPAARAPDAAAFLQALREARAAPARGRERGVALSLSAALALVALAGLWAARPAPALSPPSPRVSSPRVAASSEPSPRQAATPSPGPQVSLNPIRHGVAKVAGAAFLGRRLVLTSKSELVVLDPEGRALRRFSGAFRVIRHGPEALWLNGRGVAHRLGADLELEEVFPGPILDCDPARSEVLVTSARGVELRRSGGELIRALDVEVPNTLAVGFLLPQHVLVSVLKPRTTNLVAQRDDPTSVLRPDSRFAGRIRAVAISEDRERIATGSGAGWVLVGSASLEGLEALQRSRAGGGGLLNISVQPHNNKIAGLFLRGSQLLTYALPSGDPGEAILWDLVTGNPSAIRDAKWLRALALSEEGLVAIVGRETFELVPLKEFR